MKKKWYDIELCNNLSFTLSLFFFLSGFNFYFAYCYHNYFKFHGFDTMVLSFIHDSIKSFHFVNTKV